MIEKAEKPKLEKKPSSKGLGNSLLAVVRVRGSAHINGGIKDTLDMLKLKRINSCSLVQNDPSILGMLRKVSAYITWGEVNKEILDKMIIKRGDGKKDPKLFRLSPASKGLRSVKKNYPEGDLGYRGDKINQLLERMI